MGRKLAMNVSDLSIKELHKALDGDVKQEIMDKIFAVPSKPEIFSHPVF